MDSATTRALLAAIYASDDTGPAREPRAPMGWRDFSGMRRVAIVLNAVLLALVLGLVALVAYAFEDAYLINFGVIGAIAPALGVTGLWWWRRAVPVQGMLLIANLAVLGYTAAVVLPWLMSVYLVQGANRAPQLSGPHLLICAATLLVLAAAVSALAAQISGWRRD